jgi:folylpolyglutamate synthase/dihydropteroate synthase
LREKDAAAICRALSPIAKRFILPCIRTERALPPDELATRLSDFGLPHSVVPSFADSLLSARANPERILIAGSLHFAGEALATLQGDPDALEDCAQ